MVKVNPALDAIRLGLLVGSAVLFAVGADLAALLFMVGAFTAWRLS